MDVNSTACLTKMNVHYFTVRILKWGRRHFGSFPWRNTPNRWHALVAEVMLQRTRADQVVPVYNWFTSVYATPNEFVSRPAKVFTNLGLPERDRQFLDLNRILADQGIPHDKAELLKLPGIGEYISSAFLSLHLEKRTTLIDSNVVRAYGRFFGIKTDADTRRRKWFKDWCEAITPRRVFRDYNYGIIDFSREICNLRPLHDACTIKRRCHLFLLGSEAAGCTPKQFERSSWFDS